MSAGPAARRLARAGARAAAIGGCVATAAACGDTFLDGVLGGGPSGSTADAGATAASSGAPAGSGGQGGAGAGGGAGGDTGAGGGGAATSTTVASSASSGGSGAGGRGTGGMGGGSGGSGAGGGGVCVPNQVEPCYTGPLGTQDVGACTGGTATCLPDGSGFGPCVGEVVPAPETCATPIDDDCDGKANEEGPGCVCQPGTVVPCYTGPDGTEGVGACIGGVSACAPEGTGFGPCEGEVVPTPETCATPVDDDCDGETNEEGAGCVCVPGSTASCYTGPPGTAGVGICMAGTQACSEQGTGYGPCLGEVVPEVDDCMTPEDEDCDGTPAPCGPCPEPGEPMNETESTATLLPAITCFNANGGTVSGVVSGATDVDWYQYAGNDTGNCNVDPWVSITANAPLRVCQFFHCPLGVLTFSCPAGTSAATSPDGRPGCCGMMPFAVVLNCEGILDDDTPVRIRVDNPDGLACEPYTLKYHY